MCPGNLVLGRAKHKESGERLSIVRSVSEVVSVSVVVNVRVVESINSDMSVSVVVSIINSRLLGFNVLLKKLEHRLTNEGYLGTRWDCLLIKIFKTSSYKLMF